MSVNLRVSLGTVNYLNYVHVTATKVITSTSAPDWETWIKVPVSNYNFIIPNLLPENYYIRYYDADTATSLGMLRMEMVVNALTGEYVNERRFYTVGGTGQYDPVDGALNITDPYLVGKIISGVFKEGFRYLKDGFEYNFDSTMGIIAKIDNVKFSAPETIVVDIKYNVTSTNNISGTGPGLGLYSGILTVTTGTYTITATDRNKKIRCAGTLPTQFITLPPLSSVNIDDGFYFDNSVGGTAIQVKILTQGGDRINFNGFFTASNLFQEFWVSRGEHLLVRKMDNNNWEIQNDYKGTNVGIRMSGRLATQASYMPEDGRLLDGDEYGRLWFYINNILPNTHYIVDDNVTNTTYMPDPNRTGMFTIHSTQKKFRMPLCEGMTERGLLDFDTYGADPGRAYDYPGGFQDEMNPPHDHFMFTPPGGNNNPPYITHYHVYNNNDSYSMYSDNSQLPSVGKTGKGGGTEGRIKNIGVIYCTHI